MVQKTHSSLIFGASQEGVVFHIIGALSEYGKVGVVCIGSTPEKAKEFYDRTIEVLDFESSVD